MIKQVLVLVILVALLPSAAGQLIGIGISSALTATSTSVGQNCNAFPIETDPGTTNEGTIIFCLYGPGEVADDQSTFTYTAIVTAPPSAPLTANINSNFIINSGPCTVATSAFSTNPSGTSGWGLHRGFRYTIDMNGGGECAGYLEIEVIHNVVPNPTTIYHVALPFYVRTVAATADIVVDTSGFNEIFLNLLPLLVFLLLIVWAEVKRDFIIYSVALALAVVNVVYLWPTFEGLRLGLILVTMLVAMRALDTFHFARTEVEE